MKMLSGFVDGRAGNTVCNGSRARPPPRYSITRREDDSLQWEPPIRSRELANALSYHYPMENSIQEKMQRAILDFFDSETAAEGPINEEPGANLNSPSILVAREVNVNARKDVSGVLTKPTLPPQIESTELCGVWDIKTGQSVKTKGRKRALSPTTREEVARNRGNTCDYHHKSKTRCDSTKCRKNKLYPGTSPKSKLANGSGKRNQGRRGGLPISPLSSSSLKSSTQSGDSQAPSAEQNCDEFASCPSFEEESPNHPLIPYSRSDGAFDSALDGPLKKIKVFGAFQDSNQCLTTSVVGYHPEFEHVTKSREPFPLDTIAGTGLEWSWATGGQEIPCDNFIPNDWFSDDDALRTDNVDWVEALMASDMPPLDLDWSIELDATMNMSTGLDKTATYFSGGPGSKQSSDVLTPLYIYSTLDLPVSQQTLASFASDAGLRSDAPPMVESCSHLEQEDYNLPQISEMFGDWQDLADPSHYSDPGLSNAELSDKSLNGVGRVVPKAGVGNMEKKLEGAGGGVVESCDLSEAIEVEARRKTARVKVRRSSRVVIRSEGCAPQKPLSSSPSPSTRPRPSFPSASILPRMPSPAASILPHMPSPAASILPGAPSPAVSVVGARSSALAVDAALLRFPMLNEGVDEMQLKISPPLDPTCAEPAEGTTPLDMAGVSDIHRVMRAQAEQVLAQSELPAYTIAAKEERTNVCEAGMSITRPTPVTHSRRGRRNVSNSALVPCTRGELRTSTEAENENPEAADRSLIHISMTLVGGAEANPNATVITPHQTPESPSVPRLHKQSKCSPDAGLTLLKTTPSPQQMVELNGTRPATKAHQPEISTDQVHARARVESTQGAQREPIGKRVAKEQKAHLPATKAIERGYLKKDRPIEVRDELAQVELSKAVEHARRASRFRFSSIFSKPVDSMKALNPMKPVHSMVSLLKKMAGMKL